MITIEESAKAAIPIAEAYRLLTEFESYPRFVADVRSVERIDDARLRWRVAIEGGEQEWEMEITELSPEKCIAWRNLSGPVAVGSLVLDPVSAQETAVTVILTCGAAGEDGREPARRLSERARRDLARFCRFAEARLASETPPARKKRAPRARPRTVQGEGGNWTPPVEIAHGEKEVIVCAELPGVKRDDIRIEIRDEKLTIEGERALLRSLSEMEYRRSERPYGHFFREILLPNGIDARAAAASLQDGVLEIRVPMSPS